jgi:hypothetical protein
VRSGGGTLETPLKEGAPVCGVQKIRASQSARGPRSAGQTSLTSPSRRDGREVGKAPGRWCAEERRTRRDEARTLPACTCMACSTPGLFTAAWGPKQVTQQSGLTHDGQVLPCSPGLGLVLDLDRRDADWRGLRQGMDREGQEAWPRLSRPRACSTASPQSRRDQMRWEEPVRSVGRIVNLT